MPARTYRVNRVKLRALLATHLHNKHLFFQNRRMSLTREHLESGFMRQVFAAHPASGRCLTDEEHAASIAQLLDSYCPKCDIWVFGYGSLVWNPLFHHAERRCATLRGYHRRFCLWSIASRGTPECPGLVLGLDRGGACKGMVFRIPRARANEELRLLWRREMVIGSYEPRWITVRDRSGREIRAIAFVVQREHPAYAGRLPSKRVARTMSIARGELGPSSEYLRKTVEALAEHGIHDAHLFDVHRRVFGALPRVSGAT
jgi:cation transport protein ChaC